MKKSYLKKRIKEKIAENTKALFELLKQDSVDPRMEPWQRRPEASYLNWCEWNERNRRADARDL